MTNRIKTSPQNNGNHDTTTPSSAYHATRTRTSATPFDEALRKMRNWIGPDKLDRADGLLHLLSRVRTECPDIPDDLIPDLIEQGYNPPNFRPYTAAEVRKAMKPAVKEKKQEVETYAPAGRPASTLVKKETRYFWEPWFFQGRYHLLVGQPGAGKGTFAAYLMSRAKNPIILPGFEEDLDEDLRPRLEAHGIDPDKAIILDQGDWRMPEALPRLEREVRHWDSNFVLADPIVSYMPDTWSENDYKQSRAYNESWAKLTIRTGATGIGVYHPGKNAENVLPGSRAWREVARGVLELVVEHEGTPDERRFIRAFKNSKGKMPLPMSYTLESTEAGAPRFVPGEVLDARAVALAKEVLDQDYRHSIEIALDLLPEILGTGKVNSETAYEIGEKNKLHPKVMLRAAKRLGVVMQRGNGEDRYKYFWSLPKPEDTSTPFDEPA